MSKLEIAVASAGAGKTFDLCDTVFKALKDGVNPSRILATTFTKKSAAELKSRLQARILDGEGGDGTALRLQAERLDFAVIGTVHSVALHLVRKFARHLGLSPRMEVLPEGSERENLHAIFAGFDTDCWEKLAPLMDRLDVREEHLRETLFRLVELKRDSRLNEEEFREQMETCRARLCELLGPVTETTGQVGSIRNALQTVLTEMERLTGDTTLETKNALGKIRDIVLKGQAQWSDFPKAVNLKAGKKSGADKLLETTRGMGRGARGHQALHADVGEFYLLVTEMALGLDREYARFKEVNCQADYTDLLFHLLELLEKPEMEAILHGEFDLILVDEVQDSQPVEYAIFERLRHLSPRSRWVGDPNQAIYSFKGADPGLLDKYTADESVTTSMDADVNRRSQAGLVHFFGKVFAEKLDSRVVQKHFNPPEDRGIERWLLDSTNDASDHGACIRGVLALRDEGFALGDIAILARENRNVLELAEAFRECGIATLSASAGLLAQRECALVVAGMRLVADHADTLAAATILHHLSNPDEATPSWAVEWPRGPGRPADIHEIIRELGGDSGKKSRPYANLLKAIIDIDGRNLSPFMVMMEVNRVLGIPEAIGNWTEPCQRAGSIDSLLSLARTHEEESLAKGIPATLSGLILHLDSLARDGADLIHPIPGSNAVHLLTYHKAKGLEWPVVILTDLDKEVKVYPWQPGPAGSGAIDDPLAGRSIRYWQWPFGRSISKNFPGQFQKGTDLEDDVLQERELIEEKTRLKKEATRLLFVGCTRAKRKLVLAHRRDSVPSKGGPAQTRHHWLDDLPKIAEILDKNLEPGREHDLRKHGIETTYLIRQLAPDPETQAAGETRWFASNPRQPIAGSEIPRYQSPSHMPPGGESFSTTVESLGGRPVFPKSMEEKDLPILGQAVHAFLGAIPSLAGSDGSIWRKRAVDCLKAFGVSAFITPEELVQKAKVFRDWVQEKYPGAIWHVEVPLSSPGKMGGQWNGTTDLILELPDGDLIVVDHKSSPIKMEHCEAKALSYSGQIAAYREILETLGGRVSATFVHFPLACQIVNIRKN